MISHRTSSNTQPGAGKYRARRVGIAAPPFAINFNNTNADQDLDIYYTTGNLAPSETLHDLIGKGAGDPRSTICALPVQFQFYFDRRQSVRSQR
jgi:hypothetical protein